MNKEKLLKEYEETIEKRFELSMLLSNFDTNTQFSHSSFDLLNFTRAKFKSKIKNP